MVFDKIKYFIYKTDSNANTNLLTQRIYEYGLYPENNNENISLLIYYAFNNISNIHEIGEHININMQNRYCKDKISFENRENLGETIEIELFG